MNRVSYSTIKASKKKDPKGTKYSNFLITINPNKTYATPNSTGFDDMKKRLQVLANHILKDNMIDKFFKFNNDKTREENLGLIVEIDPDRYGVVEYGEDMHRLHVHINVMVKHKTNLMIDRNKISHVASKLLDRPEKSLNINIVVTGRSLYDYARKGLSQ